MGMTSGERREAGRAFARRVFEAADATATFNLDELQAAVASVDDWLDANVAAYNAALPLPFRSDATAAQKAALLVFCTARRAGLEL